MAKYYKNQAEAIAAVSAIQLNQMGYLQKNKGQNLDKKVPGGSGNYTKYWRDIEPSYQGSAYCLGAQDWCIWKACGSDRKQAKKVLCVPQNENFSYYTPTQSNYFKAAKRWGTQPKVGALIFFKNSVRIYHVEYVYKVTNSTVYTYGFNTSGSFNEVEANGDGCFPKSYSRSLGRIAGYGYPRYDLMVPTTTIKDKNIDFKTIKISTGVAGLNITAPLNLRDYPQTGDVVKVLTKGTKVKVTARTTIDGDPWFKITQGWISAKYVQGWILEDGKWWYVKAGYDYPKATSALIDGVTYFFDKDGYLVTSTFVDLKTGKKGYIKSDGCLAKKEWIEDNRRWIYAKQDSSLAQNEFLIIYNETYGNELFYFGDDYYLRAGKFELETNERGALVYNK